MQLDALEYSKKHLPITPSVLNAIFLTEDPYQRKESYMSGILCAVRGGTDSQSTIARSITLAQETGLPLHFLYIVNLDFLSYTSSSRVHTITREMEQMGEFILATAESSANSKGVAAQSSIRHGNVMKEIIAACHEIHVDYLVLGQPRIQREDSLFTQEQLEKFIQRTEEQTGAKVILSERDHQ
jgi:nucleotide-binding universal stress UspA family protein